MDDTGDVVNDNATSKQALQSSTEAEAADEEQDLAYPLKGVRLLVVDDSIPILKMMSMTLDNRGKAMITQAKDGLEAISRCESVIAAGGPDFSVILTDIQMVSFFCPNSLPLSSLSPTNPTLSLSLLLLLLLLQLLLP